jgi:HSP20 family protein
MATNCNIRVDNERAEQTRGGRTYVPAVDIIERDDELLLLADVPGAHADGIDVNYDRGELTITARVTPRQAPETRYTACEYGVGTFVRTFRIGEGINAAKIQAELSQGVLTLHLPKAEDAKARKITVQAH